MKRERLARAAAYLALAALAFVVVLAKTHAQQTGSRDSAKAPVAQGKNAVERASGVITKVDRITPEGSQGSGARKEGNASQAGVRISINTNAVWRDWARDQATLVDRGPARKDATKGDESVATKGEPVDKNNVIVIDVTSDTKLDTRFRAPDDESTKGAKTPEAARTDDPSARSATKSDAGKAVTFHLNDLKPGLFVEVDFRHVSVRNPATTLTVIRPIGGAQSTDRPK